MAGGETPVEGGEGFCGRKKIFHLRPVDTSVLGNHTWTWMAVLLAGYKESKGASVPIDIMEYRSYATTCNLHATDFNMHGSDKNME